MNESERLDGRWFGEEEVCPRPRHGCDATYFAVPASCRGRKHLIRAGRSHQLGACNSLNWYLSKQVVKIKIHRRRVLGQGFAVGARDCNPVTRERDPLAVHRIGAVRECQHTLSEAVNSGDCSLLRYLQKDAVDGGTGTRHSLPVHCVLERCCPFVVKNFKQVQPLGGFLNGLFGRVVTARRLNGIRTDRSRPVGVHVGVGPLVRGAALARRRGPPSRDDWGFRYPCDRYPYRIGGGGSAPVSRGRGIRGGGLRADKVRTQHVSLRARQCVDEFVHFTAPSLRPRVGLLIRLLRLGDVSRNVRRRNGRFPFPFVLGGRHGINSTCVNQHLAKKSEETKITTKTTITQVFNEN